MFSNPLFQPTVPINTEKINPVDAKLSIYLGVGVFLILLVIINNLFNENKSTAKLDSSGCILDGSGNRIKTPRYAQRTTYDNRGNQRLESTGRVVGYDDCTKPMSNTTKYIITFCISGVIGLIASSIMYNAQFSIANPQLAASMYVADKINDSNRYRYNNVYRPF
jgi:hypothetical protein